MKNNYRMWLISLLMAVMMAGCKDGEMITSPKPLTSPAVSSTDPDNTATEVILTQPITATFSKTMDDATLSTVTFTLMQGTTPIPGIVTYSNITATFTPDSVFEHYATYSATITTGAKDLAGKSLTANYVWSFTTGGPLLGSACGQCHN